MNRGRCSRFLGQKISWAKESLEERLTPPAHRPVTRQRTRTHSKPRRQWRRNSMQRTAALAATFLRRFFHTHPVPARGALRIQTLHRPSWKLHFTSRRVKFGTLRKRGNCMPFRPKKNNAPVKLAGLCAHAFGVSRKMSAISCGPLPTQISPEMDRIEGRFGNIRKIFLACAKFCSTNRFSRGRRVEAEPP